MREFTKHLNKNKILYLSILSFLIPLGALFIIYLSNDIYFGSNRTVLAGDGYHQYVVFHNAIKNILAGDGSLFYNWNIGLGVNFYALSAYYLGSLFTPLVYFFDVQSMPNAIYLLTLLKFGTIGISAFTSFRHIFKKAAVEVIFGLSICFTLMSFITSMSEIIMWLDVFIYLPLVLWGLDRLMKQRKNGLFFTSLLLLLMSNYYFGFMICIFIGLYYFSLLVGDFSRYRTTIVSFLKTSLLAGTASLIVLLPVFIDLRTVGESMTAINQFKTDDTGLFDLLYKNFIGAYDTTQYDALPMIYVGLIPLFLAILYFFNQRFSRKQRIASGLLISFIIASFYIQPLNLAWQGMHSPNMFLFRFSFLFSTLIILLAGKNAEYLDGKMARQFCISIIGFIGIFLISQLWQNNSQYAFLTTASYYLTFSFLIAYFIINFGYLRKLITKTFYCTILVCLIIFEMIANTTLMITGIGDEWVYPDQTNYQQTVKDVLPLAQQINHYNSSFVRTENLNPIVANDGMLFNLNTISQFSSVRNTDSSGALNQLGYLSEGTNLNLRYQNNTLLADSLFGIKYLLSKDSVNRFGYSEFLSSGAYTAYENQFAAPLAVMTSSDNSQKQLSTSQLESQKILANYLANTDLNYFQVNYLSKPEFINSTLETKIDSTKWTINRQKMNQPITMKFTVKVPANQQAYYMLEADENDDTDNNVTVTINNQSVTKKYSEIGKYYDLGYYSTETEITFAVTFPSQATISMYPPKIALLDLTSYQEAMQKIKAKGVDLKVSGNQASGTFDADSDQTLFLSIPYNQGWIAKVDGKAVTTKRLFKGFLAIEIPKGKHKIELSFIPVGFKIGAICFIGAILCFLLSEWLAYIIKRRPKPKYRHSIQKHPRS
ncbi:MULTISPECIES: YfhO family protein [unclassified Enterococcus]|uniref:YfhO family protein n=1 Tax=unclassified Enterococcus TaxID=2608891 RepID=UPI001552CEF3|nr:MULTISPECIES: YfhO family protein [unclassified Enterococcus]MBS7578208.1 YfhO family protein [Enterococcus sp. MMGLQ5-2]MBS7585416.1 YfhO family protein [Enterococcus sp. MMGLQ5-1]NPD13273.1 YfhO family protein [Enterococcus sp. MMGLQ5-1]NPD38039.1 YfhO family protein [Enterococcus sp. MMGLQ5-2]